ncbi:hypothetical protein B6N60_03572 [Richelia sinica FACHB-800]|uniref:Uncharacterized protein n=1 Tax=Richelia sinica FACHB-800 TaxID=1357546 RepID=A0A975T9Y9_9NOST|nr:hypothetical protein [Richelia sinica]MBD2667096.1 hypothetical protein [Richelia sinica FACHB-800]QXE24862.1 hypothetical protein B6N60_03572 [Richelia sinica FACHB-800]
MKISFIIKLVLPVLIIIICLIVYTKLESGNNQKTKLCDNNNTLTQIPVKNYDQNGVNKRDGTFIVDVDLNKQRNLKAIIFPKALSPQTWSKVPQSSIQYLGKGGDESWREWLSPDYFYLLTVPDNTTGLAFGRLCYRNGDVEVEPIKKLQKMWLGKIKINDKISIYSPVFIPNPNQNIVIVNTGSNYRDELGTVTEVYFTPQQMKSD